MEQQILILKALKIDSWRKWSEFFLVAEMKDIFSYTGKNSRANIPHRSQGTKAIYSCPYFDPWPFIYNP